MGHDQSIIQSKFRIDDAEHEYPDKVYLTPSINKKKKWRISWTDSEGKEKHVDFGAKGASDFTKHQDSRRMSRYVGRHLGKGGFGKLPKNVRDLPKNTKLSKSQKKEIIDAMIKVKSSPKEKWGKSGMNTAGFWSRWLTWSHPNLEQAKQFIKKEFDISVIQKKSKRKKSEK
jgi:hypothetical protein